MFVHLTGTHIVLTISLCYMLCNSLLWLHLLGIYYAFTLFISSGERGMLSNKMWRNVAASNDQLTNLIKHLWKKSKFKAVFTYRQGLSFAICLKAIQKKNDPQDSSDYSDIIACGMSAYTVSVYRALNLWCCELSYCCGDRMDLGFIALAFGSRSGWDWQVMHYDDDGVVRTQPILVSDGFSKSCWTK